MPSIPGWPNRKAAFAFICMAALLTAYILLQRELWPNDSNTRGTDLTRPSLIAGPYFDVAIYCRGGLLLLQCKYSQGELQLSRLEEIARTARHSDIVCGECLAFELAWYLTVPQLQQPPFRVSRAFALHHRIRIRTTGREQHIYIWPGSGTVRTKR